MRILYFSQAYTTHDWRFLDKLAASRHEVFYLRLEDTGNRYEFRELPAGVRTVAWDEPWPCLGAPTEWIQVMPQFEALVERIRPDVIHAGPVQSCAFIAALSGFRPVMAMSWGSDILVDAERGDTWRWATRHALRHADMIQCDCMAVKMKVQSLVPISDDRFVVFPWGVERDRFHPDGAVAPFRTERGWENDTVILSTRTWEPIYGIETLLQGFQLAHARNPRLKLVMAADGSLAPAIHAFISDSGLHSSVYLPGRLTQADLPGYYRASDVYVSCALSDGSSISLLEAMACGLPVIATDIPSNREWLQPGRNGWLTEPKDACGVAESLLSAAGLEPEARAAMGNANVEVIAEHADWDANFHKLLDAYDRMEGRAQKEVAT